jgi:hypothetical protein
MTTASLHPSPPPMTHHQPGLAAGRVLALVVSILTMLGGLGFVALGVAILAVDSDQRDGDFLTSDETSLATSGYAVTAYGIDIDELPSDSLFGRARLRVTGADPGAEVFVGVARADDLAAYLSGVEHATVSEIGGTGTRYNDHPGGAPASSPDDLDIWVAQASGPRTQEVTWQVEEGRWAVVVMNADATAGVDVRADVGATAPWLRRIAAGLLVVGSLAVLTGAVVVFATVRRARRAHLTNRRAR